MTKSNGEDLAVTILRGRLDGQQRRRLSRLLDMLYRPSELADEVGFMVRQVYRVYLPAGCPHERDDRRHVWINGKAFRAWIAETYQKAKLAHDEAYCLTCKRPVKMVAPVEAGEGELVFWLCTCPNCGRKLARIIDRKRQGHDRP